MNVRNLFLALLAAIAVVFAACGDDDDGGAETTLSPTPGAVATSSSAPEPFPVTITDDNGVAITLEAAPTRIVALAPSFVEVLFAVGAGDAIVAADENTDYPPEAASIPKLSGYEPSVEGIASYAPDLVLMCCFDAGGLQDSLTNLDVPTMFFDSPATVEGVYGQIVTLGQIAGRGEEAEEIVSQMRSDIDGIVSQLEDVDIGPSVFHELDSMLFTVGPGSFPDEVYSLLKATNVAESTGGAYPQMSAEAVIAAAPEVIILGDADFGESAEGVAARPGWDQIPAVVNGRVYGVSAALLSQPTPRLVDDVRVLAELLYPEVF